MKSSIAIAALVVATIGLSAAPAFAQSGDAQIGLSLNGAPPAMPSGGDDVALGLDGAAPAGPELLDARAMMPMRGGMGAGGQILMLACSDRGAEALDAALLHLSYRLDLTDAQKPLYDAFRTKALSTQTSFADGCKADLPAKTADAKPDLIARLKAGLAIESARLTALNTVLPDFEALYNTLSDTQKASLLPERPQGAGQHMLRQFNGGDMGRAGRPTAPGRG